MALLAQAVHLFCRKLQETNLASSYKLLSLNSSSLYTMFNC